MVKTCEVCNQESKKYRCPQCHVNYCSVGCYKKHTCERKQVEQSVIPQEHEEIIKSEYVDEEDKLLPARLELLKQSKKIRNLLQSTKLRAKLQQMDNSKQRYNDLNAELKHNPDFQDFCTQILITLNSIGTDGKFIG